MPLFKHANGAIVSVADKDAAAMTSGPGSLFTPYDPTKDDAAKGSSTTSKTPTGTPAK